MAASCSVPFFALVIIALLPMLQSFSQPTIENVLTALEKMLTFYQNSYKDMNLDGMYGLRVLEGHMILLLEEHDRGKHQHLPPETLSRLRLLQAKATNIGTAAIPYLKKQDPKYYAHLSFLVAQPWNIWLPHRKINPALKWRPQAEKPGEISEEESDKCMGEMVGSNLDEEQPCGISEACIKTMTTRGFIEYSITHQLLWTMLAQKAGCGHLLDKHLKQKGLSGGMKDFHAEFCTNNFYEMHSLIDAAGGKFLPRLQDLFLEQQFVCPSIGFVEFLRLDWLGEILSWQKPSGCYGKMPMSDQTKGLYEAAKARGFLMDEQDYDYEGQRGEMQQQQQQKPRIQPQLKQGFQQQGDNNEGGQFQQQQQHKPLVNLQNQESNGQNQAPFGDDQDVHPHLKQQEQQQELKHGQQQEQQQQHGQQEKHQAQDGFREQQHDEQHDEQHQRERKEEHYYQQQEQQQEQQQQDEEAAEEGGVNYKEEEGDKPREAGRRMFAMATTEAQLSATSSQTKQRVHEPPNAVHLSQTKFNRNKSGEIYKENVVAENANIGFKDVKDSDVNGQFTGRKLLAEKNLKDGCLAHKTAVAAGALVMYLRYMIDPGPQEFQHLSLAQVSRGKIMKRMNLESENRGMEKEEDYKENDAGNEDRIAVDKPGEKKEEENYNDENGDKNKDGEEDNNGDEGNNGNQENGDVGDNGKGGNNADEGNNDEGDNNDDEENNEEDNGNGANNEDDGNNGDRENNGDEVNNGDEADNEEKDNLDANNGLPNKRDEEYEQYIDNNEETKKKLNNAQALLKKTGDVQVPVRAETTKETQNKHANEEEHYEYHYDEYEEHKRFMHKLSPAVESIAGTEANKADSVPTTDQSEPHLGIMPLKYNHNDTLARTHVYIFIATSIVLLALLYRFVRQRRILIRYNRKCLYRV